MAEGSLFVPIFDFAVNNVFGVAETVDFGGDCLVKVPDYFPWQAHECQDYACEACHQLDGCHALSDFGIRAPQMAVDEELAGQSGVFWSDNPGKHTFEKKPVSTSEATEFIDEFAGASFQSPQFLTPAL
jgi:hypothetical protein